MQFTQQGEILVRNDIEGMIISSLLGSNNSDLELIQTMLELTPSSFRSSHRKAFEVLLERFNSDKPLRLDDILSESNPNADALFLNYANSVRGNSNLKYYRETLLKLITVDDYIAVGQSYLDIGKSKGDIDTKISALKDIYPQAATSIDMTPKTLPDALKEFLVDFEKDFEKGESTGFLNLDTMLHKEGNGIEKGSLVVILGGSKQGKSALATSIWLNRLDENKCSIAYTMEISRKEFVQNCVAQACNVSRTDIKKRRHEDDEIAASLLQHAPALANKHGAIIYDTPNMTLNFIIQTARAHARKMPVNTILIDYLTLIKRPDSRQPDYQAYGEMVTALRQLAKELNCIVLLVSQVTKDSQKRADKRPQRTDARDTSQLIYDSHLMLGTYVDSYKLPNKPRQMEVNIILNRNGIADEKCYFHFQGGNLTLKRFDEGKMDEVAIEAAKLSSIHATM